MIGFLDWLLVLLTSVVEGITEWLPISSTGHMLLVQHFFPFHNTEIFNEDYLEMFDVVIQLGAIMAVVTLYFKRLNPFNKELTEKKRNRIWMTWFYVVIATVPAAVLGVLFDDFLDEHLYNAYVISAMLILYGIGFIVMEYLNKDKTDYRIDKMRKLDWKTALMIGGFQCLSLIPGTSRSGATILGAMIVGCSRGVATQFSFFLAIPVMFGASLLKIVKYLLESAGSIHLIQIVILLVAMAVAYGVSMFAIKFLMQYIKQHDFKVFGYYRIGLGILVLILLVCFHL